MNEAAIDEGYTRLMRRRLQHTITSSPAHTDDTQYFESTHRALSLLNSQVQAEHDSPPIVEQLKSVLTRGEVRLTEAHLKKLNRSAAPTLL